MCFSANASFAAGAVLSAAGTVSVSRAKGWRSRLYAAVCCGSLVSSSRRWVRVMGLVTALSLAISLMIAKATAVSVWCFFSALLSVTVFMNFRAAKKRL